MRLINQVLKLVIGKFVVVHFDDILAFSRSEEGHAHYLHEALSILVHEKLYGNIQNSYFFLPKVFFLHYVVSAQGIYVDERKIKRICEWPTPTSVQEV